MATAFKNDGSSLVRHLICINLYLFFSLVAARGDEPFEGTHQSGAVGVRLLIICAISFQWIGCEHFQVAAGGRKFRKQRKCFCDGKHGFPCAKQKPTFVLTHLYIRRHWSKCGVRVLSLVGTPALSLSQCAIILISIAMETNSLVFQYSSLGRALSELVGSAAEAGVRMRTNIASALCLSILFTRALLIKPPRARFLYTNTAPRSELYSRAFLPFIPQERLKSACHRKNPNAPARKKCFERRENIFAYFSRELGNECTNCRPAANANKQVFHSLVCFYSKRLIRDEKSA